MKDSDIDYSDIPALDKTFLRKATTEWPPAKKQLTIRLDADVLTWLKGHGKGYQTRINRILRVVMESQPPRLRIARWRVLLVMGCHRSTSRERPRCAGGGWRAR